MQLNHNFGKKMDVKHEGLFESEKWLNCKKIV